MKIVPFNTSFQTQHGIWMTGAIVLLPTLYLSLHGEYGLVVAMMFFVTILMIWLRNQALSIAFTFGFLLALGDIRRIVDMIRSSRGLDPLLLVGALFSLYLAAPILMRLQLKDRLSQSVLFLMIIMILEMFNPKQGPIIVGFSGALFFIVPVLWFWIGRRYATDRVMYLLFYRVFIPMGVLAALLGIYQTFVGFLPWEQAWIDSVKGDLTALYLSPGHIRSIGFSASGLEFGDLMLIASISIIGAALARRRVYLLVLPILFTAILLASMRNIIVRTLFASVMMWALSGKGGKGWVGRLGFAMALGAGLLIYSSSGLSGPAQQQSYKSVRSESSAQAATIHVTAGLAHPLDSKVSTAGLHWQLFTEGIIRGFTAPAGMGLGSATLGAGKFGGATAGLSTEIDISDTFSSLGFIGGFLYLYVMFLTFKSVFYYLRIGPQYLSLPLAGLLAGMFSQWIALGQYAVGPFVWFCMGFLCRQEASRLSGVAREKTNQAVQTKTVVLQAS